MEAQNEKGGTGSWHGEQRASQGQRRQGGRAGMCMAGCLPSDCCVAAPARAAHCRAHLFHLQVGVRACSRR